MIIIIFILLFIFLLIQKKREYFNNELISVIIPTYNRFNYLLNTIKSVKDQTYKNIEIIVINDCSTEKEYYNYNWEKNRIKIIHLPKNSKKIFGYGCVGYVRNEGLKKATGEYIAFCDDDDIWFPKKIELQLKAMKKNNCKMSSTDGLIGKGIYDIKKKYKKYNAEKYYYKFKNNKIPKIWDLKFLKKHNFMITSSVILDKNILDKINGFTYKRRGQDYDCWLKALNYTNSVYIKDICFYYDKGHGKGQNH